MDPLIIEARVNEYATRNKGRNVPWLPNEIAGDATYANYRRFETSGRLIEP